MKLIVQPKVDQSWSILKIAQEAAPGSWKSVFASAEPELAHISQKLDNESVFGSYYPLKKDIFGAFKLTSLENVKVILFEYEPSIKLYDINDTHLPEDQGLSYCYYDDTECLDMIHRELKRSLPKYDSQPDLKKWARQGVLLLRISLTTSASGSHAEYELWHGFLNKVLQAIDAENDHVIALLWGKNVQTISRMLPKTFEILEAGSPGEYRADTTFIGCDHFVKVNELLKKYEKTQIVW